ncbi:O-acetyl-ADP-ribose deacetylase [Kocuria tytonicola]|uniref:O-acetyl-ADP-ribose deacetylase n=1 Tax=Kocuria tytonicola TaxID=2055946 RepID=UPI000EF93083|nr:O-acetyl-ADP-ribose deacetylase [Kocuria tytonicola]RLZ04282.1 O-acetyl-ADP-ribose deacetylase [Kocuria tytonicola]
MNIEIRKGDITKVQTDAIVNAANSKLLGGGGVDGAIHRAAGKQLLAECRQLRETTLQDGLPAGQAVATDGYDLPARWVIHTVGPVYAKTKDKSDILASCYRESLRVADEIGATSVAFPAISAGIYGWPMDGATQIAVDTVLAADTDVDTVVFVPFSPEAETAFQAALDAAQS